MPCKVDTGSDGNIMPFNIFIKLFPSATTDQLAATKDAIKLRTYDHTTIKQLGRYKVDIENNKCKIHFLCSFRRQRSITRHARLWIIKHFKFNCNTVGTEKEEKDTSCNASKDSILSAGCEQCFANTGLERSCAKTNSNTNWYTERE